MKDNIEICEMYSCTFNINSENIVNSWNKTNYINTDTGYNSFLSHSSNSRKYRTGYKNKSTDSSDKDKDKKSYTHDFRIESKKISAFHAILGSILGLLMFSGCCCCCCCGKGPIYLIKMCGCDERRGRSSRRSSRRSIR